MYCYKFMPLKTKYVIRWTNAINDPLFQVKSRLLIIGFAAFLCLT